MLMLFFKSKSEKITSCFQLKYHIHQIETCRFGETNAVTVESEYDVSKSFGRGLRRSNNNCPRLHHCPKSWQLHLVYHLILPNKLLDLAVSGFQSYPNRTNILHQVVSSWTYPPARFEAVNGSFWF